MKKEFQELANEVGLIIDLDGGVVHKYLPEDFKGRYIVWKISCVFPESVKFPGMKLGFKGNMKKFVMTIWSCRS